MTNWKTYKITSKKTFPGSCYIFAKFELDGYVTYEKGKDLKGIALMFYEDDSSINNYQIGDYLEINIDETINRNGQHAIPMNLPEAKNVVRKFGSSSSTNIITTRGSSSDIVISPGAVNAMKSPRTMEIAREMSRIVDETGKEVEFKIEDANSNLKYSLILRKQN